MTVRKKKKKCEKRKKCEKQRRRRKKGEFAGQRELLRQSEWSV